MGRIFILLFGFFLASCSFKNPSFIEDCETSGAEFSKTGASSVALRFIDNGRCFYEAAAISETGWEFRPKSGVLKNFSSKKDEFSENAGIWTESRDGVFHLELDPRGEIIEKKEGLRQAFIIKRGEAEIPQKAADYVISARCGNKGGFSLRVRLDGGARWELGEAYPGKKYLDIYGAKMAPDFEAKGCRGLVSFAKASFPERIRFLISDFEGDSLKVSAAGNFITVSEKVFENRAYILKIEETAEKNVQTLKIYVSAEVRPEAEEISPLGVSVDLGLEAAPVSALGYSGSLKGPVFSSFRIIGKKGGAKLLLKAAGPSSPSLWVEKTRYGFVIYAKIS